MQNFLVNAWEPALLGHNCLIRGLRLSEEEAGNISFCGLFFFFFSQPPLSLFFDFPAQPSKYMSVGNPNFLKCPVGG